MSRQATIVSFWGDKPPALAALLDRIRTLLREAFGDDFRPYAEEQVHATIVGLERLPGSLRNRRLAKGGPCPAMDFDGLRQRLLAALQPPMQIRIGGFGEGELPFASRGQAPYARSFSIQGDKIHGDRIQGDRIQGDRAVLMGWPVAAGERESYSGDLDLLRREALHHHVLHAWHEAPGAIDNDLYMRVGLLPPDAHAELGAAVVRTVREELSLRGPIRFPLAAADLFVVSYDDETLPPATTRVMRLQGEVDWPSLYRG